mmetsp:Transcript_53798/g.83750  ORF Transcript_53798/g.83750 Transcript_53798/m.83750 type:complete len:321 (+) Transcript_53798:2-964(+)
MTHQAPDHHLLWRLTQLEKDLNGVCNEIHQRRPASRNSRARTSSRHSNEPRRKSSPRPHFPRSASRGELRKQSGFAAPPQHWDQQLSAVLEAPSTARRIGASREDCNETKCASNAYTMARDTSACSSDFLRISPSLAKSQSTTTAGLGSSSSGSYVALGTITSAKGSGGYLRSDASFASSPRCRQRTDSHCGSVAGQSPRSWTRTSCGRSVRGPTEIADVDDSNSSHAEAKRNLVWQLELERLRNATLKLEVQREICESSDLRKRLWATEVTPLALASTLYVPTVPAISPMPSVPMISTIPSMTGVPVVQPPSNIQNLRW